MKPEESGKPRLPAAWEQAEVVGSCGQAVVIFSP